MESANRQEIINVATTLFRKKGYTATSIGEIVNTSGLTKGALYYYFSSKEELAFAVIKQVKEYFDNEIFVLAHSTNAADVVQRAEQFNAKVEVFFSAHTDGCLLANLTLELGASYEVFKNEILDYFQKWEQCYCAFFSNTCSKEDAKILAADALASVQGCILMYRASGDLAMLKRQHQNIVRMCSKNSTN